MGAFTAAKSLAGLRVAILGAGKMGGILPHCFEEPEAGRDGVRHPSRFRR